jgi:hypothetical protein
MFEHKHLDGEWNRVVPSSDAFINGYVLECRDSIGGDPDTISRRQYGVIGDRLVERCLPPESIGDCWSHDDAGLPWWGSVMNPPHMGIVAEFNTHNSGLHRKPFDAEHNVVAFASAGEEVTFSNGIYTVVRQSDEQELMAPTLVELRKLYFA